MQRWPELHYEQWADTLHTLHLWTQIVGNIRLRQEPLMNHWWNVALYVTARGLTTSVMPHACGRSFVVDFDFIDHALNVEECDGTRSGFALVPMTVAEFYRRLMRVLDELDLSVPIDKKPNEIADAIPFDRDTVHASYDSEFAERFWRVLLQADRLFKEFRSGFVGKSSPVQFFWGSFDLAVSRFSGRPAPPHPGGFPNFPDAAVREAYSHEEFSAGFWPGGNGVDAAFYAYAYPEPQGYAQSRIHPGTAGWNQQLKEFLLPYEAARACADPGAAVREFLNSTYEAAADLANWDRAALERRPKQPARFPENS